MRSPRVFAAALLLLSGDWAVAQQVSIAEPPEEVIVFADKIKVSGRTKAVRAGVMVWAHVIPPRQIIAVGFPPQATPVRQDGVWGVELDISNIPMGASFQVQAGVGLGDLSTRRYIKGDPAIRGEKQDVCFTWTPGAGRLLVEIARGTGVRWGIEGSHDHFIRAVQLETERVFKRSYRGLGLTVVPGPGMNVHEIEMSPGLLPGEFGRTVYDYGNRRKGQPSAVWIGSIAHAILSDFKAWGPMESGDSWQDRAVDLGQILGRSAAHEVAHGLGLVGPPHSPGAWMGGDSAGHNHARFGDGLCIMDPWAAVRNCLRLAQPNPNERSWPRSPAGFNAFNRCYLEHLLP
jgi:hypothetical protein